MTPADVSVVLCTCPTVAAGHALAHTLLEERLVACVNMVDGVRSIYRWDGAICEDNEVLLVIKTTTDKLSELTTRIANIHPYDVPEVLALPTIAGHSPYLDWVAASVATPDNIADN